MSQSISPLKVSQQNEARPSLRGVSPASPEGESEVSFTELLGTLVDARWLILAATAIAVLLGGAYVLLAPPVYRADALVQVEEKSGGMEGLADLSAMFNGGSTPAEAEIQLIRSRLVVGSVVEKLRLDIEAYPRHFPLIGAAIARRHKNQDTLAPPRFGLSRFAWGGERILIDTLSVPEWMERMPLELTVGEGGHYRLADEDGTTLLEGEAGKLATGSASAHAGGEDRDEVRMLVTDLRARPGTRFTVVKLSVAEATVNLQTALKVAERGKKTGIIEMALDGRSKQRVLATLDAIADGYLRQNVERKSAEAEQTLDFVTKQLPVLKENLEKAEVALNEYRTKTGSVNIGMEAQAVVEQATAAESKITELELMRSELEQRFTDDHPQVVALRRKLSQLRSEKANVEKRLKGLPGTELVAARLTRDVSVSNELYLLLLNKAQELRMVKSGTIGNVRIIDAAQLQIERISPKTPFILMASLVLGLGAGLALAFARRAINSGVEDPSKVETEMGISVYGSVPHSAKQTEMVQAARRRPSALVPLALKDPSDLAIESLRSLRTSLQFALAESGTNLVCIGGPRPGIGKSFVSTNLAHVLSDSGLRVLLVDADMRKGQLHRHFGQERENGLSELIRGSAPLASAVRTTGVPSLSFISTGAIPPNPSELLGSSRFRQLVKEMSAQFDLVLLDAPPVLAVTDAAILAQLAGVNLMVLKAGMHPMREIAAAVGRLERAGVKVTGFVFNDVQLRSGRLAAARGGYHYQYEYK